MHDGQPNLISMFSLNDVPSGNYNELSFQALSGVAQVLRKSKG